MAFLYKLLFSNGKVYIGQTSGSIKKRFRSHSYSANGKSNLPVHKAWRSMGAPTVQCIGEFGSEEISAEEIKAISEHNSMLPNGYNVSPGGEISPMLIPGIARYVANKKIGFKFSEESLKKMSESQKGRKHTEEAKKKISLANKSKVCKPVSNETKVKMSEAKKLKWSDPVYREKMSLIKKGKTTKPHTDASKALMSEARKGKMSPEGEAKRKAAQISAVKGKKLTTEHRSLLSEIRKQWWAQKKDLQFLSEGLTNGHI